VLEVHTLVHVVCALLMYILWLKKPVDVRDLTVVDGRVVWPEMKERLSYILVGVGNPNLK
jgi:hypothetical protein